MYKKDNEIFIDCVGEWIDTNVIKIMAALCWFGDDKLLTVYDKSLKSIFIDP